MTETESKKERRGLARSLSVTHISPQLQGSNAWFVEEAARQGTCELKYVSGCRADNDWDVWRIDEGDRIKSMQFIRDEDYLEGIVSLIREGSCSIPCYKDRRFTEQDEPIRIDMDVSSNHFTARIAGYNTGLTLDDLMGRSCRERRTYISGESSPEEIAAAEEAEKRLKLIRPVCFGFIELDNGSCGGVWLQNSPDGKRCGVIDRHYDPPDSNEAMESFAEIDSEYYIEGINALVKEGRCEIRYNRSPGSAKLLMWMKEGKIYVEGMETGFTIEDLIGADKEDRFYKDGYSGRSL